MQGMVAAGVGVALMPLLAVDMGDPRTRAVDMSGKVPPRLIGVAWHRDRVQSVAARSFIELAIAGLRRTGAPAAAGHRLKAPLLVDHHVRARPQRSTVRGDIMCGSSW